MLLPQQIILIDELGKNCLNIKTREILRSFKIRKSLVTVTKKNNFDDFEWIKIIITLYV